MSFAPGTRLGHHEIVETLGAGMGQVHRPLDVTLGRQAALKVLPRDLARDPSRIDRSRREAPYRRRPQSPAYRHDLFRRLDQDS